MSVSMRSLGAWVCVFSLMGSIACKQPPEEPTNSLGATTSSRNDGRTDRNTATPSSTRAVDTGSRSGARRSGPAPTFDVEVVRRYPHSHQSFTQGLEFYNGSLYESTGVVGASGVTIRDLESNQVRARWSMPEPHFGEGMTVLNRKLYVITWQSQKGFILDPEQLTLLGEFRYTGEGWGLTNDGESLILSDGTERLRFIDPLDYRVKRTVRVMDHRTPIQDLNEIEYIDGYVYANVWHTDRIARIDAQSGRVVAWINLRSIVPGPEGDDENVLNGIAYDRVGQRLIVTGKRWRQMYEIRVLWGDGGVPQ
jgi:glutaminyl-peptide cyclotransferase